MLLPVVFMPEGKSVSLLSGVAGLYGAIRVRESDILVLTGPFLNKPLTEELYYNGKSFFWNFKEPMV